jgi:hypothetical protein
MPRYDVTSLYVAPTLLVGVGGTGVETIRLIKSRVKQAFGKLPGIVEFLTVDTEPCPNLPGQERILDREFAYLGGYSASSVLDNLDGHPHIKRWWNSHNVVTGSIHAGARQKRCVGRLSLYVNWGRFTRLLEPKTQRIREIVEKERLQTDGAAVERATGRVQVYVISSVCGGTGSGTFLDVAFRLRQTFGESADIVGIFLLPSCFLPDIHSRQQRNRVMANAYATLRELNHFMKGSPFEAGFPDKVLAPVPVGADAPHAVTLTRPFDSVYLVDRSNGQEYLSSLDAVRRMVAQNVFLEMVTPIGKAFGSRRANLRDLAGELVATSNGHRQPLAVAGFATASLILPGEWMVNSAAGSLMSSFLDRRVLGPAPTTAEESALVPELDARFTTLDTELRFERGGQAPAQMSVAEIIRGGPATAPSVDVSDENYTRVLRLVLENLRAAFREDVSRHGLRRIEFTLQDLVRRVERRSALLQQEEQQLDERLAALYQELGQKPPRNRPWARSEGQAEWSARQARLQGEQRDCQTLRRRSQRTLTAYAALRQVLGVVCDEVLSRIDWIGGLAATVLHGDSSPNGAEAGLQAPGGLDMFELATEVGRETHSFGTNGHTTQQSFLGAHIGRSRAALALRPDDEDGLLRDVVEDGLFAFTSGAEFRVEPLTPTSRGHLELSTRERMRSYARAALGDSASVRIVEYLDWFYKNVRHGLGPSRGSPIDPVLMLRLRCISPFLEIDAARAGSASMDSTEDVALLGVDCSLAVDETAADVLGDLESFEDVSTGLPERLDVSLSRHGFPIAALRSLPELARVYAEFRAGSEDVHIDCRWPEKVQMEDLV